MFNKAVGDALVTDADQHSSIGTCTATAPKPSVSSVRKTQLKKKMLKR